MAGSHDELPELPSHTSTNDDKHQSDTGGGWYDTLEGATVTSNPPTKEEAEGQPMHYKTDFSADVQMECEYDVIGSPRDEKEAEGSEPYPVFSVGDYYAEVDKSEMEQRKSSVKPPDSESYPVFSAEGCYAEIDSKRETKQRSKSISVPATIAETCEVSPTHEYAVVRKPKKARSIDNIVNPSDDTTVPPPIPLVTISCEEADEKSKKLSSENKIPAEQCKELSSGSSNRMPTCDVLPLWPTSTQTMEDNGHTEKGCGSNMAHSHPSLPLHTEDGHGSGHETVDMQDIPQMEC